MNVFYRTNSQYMATEKLALVFTRLENQQLLEVISYLKFFASTLIYSRSWTISSLLMLRPQEEYKCLPLLMGCWNVVKWRWQQMLCLKQHQRYKVIILHYIFCRLTFFKRSDLFFASESAPRVEEEECPENNWEGVLHNSIKSWRKMLPAWQNVNLAEKAGSNWPLSFMLLQHI